MRADRALCALLVLAAGACDGRDLILGDPPAANGGGAGKGGGAGGAGGAEDAGTAGSAGDAGGAGSPAEPMFGEPRVIEELAVADSDDDDPSLSEDRLLLCFNSERDGGQGEEDIWCARRTATTVPWATPEPVQGLNSDRRETGIALSADGLSLWFSSDREDDARGLDVYTSRRSTRDAEWSTPERVESLSSDADDLVSAVDERALQLLLARRAREGDDDDYDVFISQRTAASGPWLTPQALADVNSDEEESDAFLAGGLTLLFTRDEDLVLARRPSLDAPFDRGTPIDELNSDGDDRDAWANAGLTYIVFSSNRNGTYLLYEAAR